MSDKPTDLQYQVIYDKCMHCKRTLSPQEALDCEKQKFLPFCSEHLAYYKKIWEKIIPVYGVFGSTKKGVVKK